MHRGKTPGTTVLVVDDEPLIRWSLKQSLVQAGFQVLDAGDGRDALRVLDRADDIGAVLLDLKLPDANGLTLLHTIKCARPACPVILMTAYGTPETAEEAAREGAYRLVSKPFNVDDMVALVRTALAA